METRERNRDYCNLSGRNDGNPTISVMMEIRQKGTDFKEYLQLNFIGPYGLDEWQIVGSTNKLENIGRGADLRREGGGDYRTSFENFEFEENPNGGHKKTI